MSSIIYSSPLTTPSKYQQKLQEASTVQHSTYRSPNAAYGSPPVEDGYSNNSANSVIRAFRELQTKQKNIEQERILAIKDRDEMRHKLSELRRNQALWRSKSEIEATDNFLTVRTANERLKFDYGDVQAKLATQESKLNSIERHRIALKSMQATLQDDVSSNDARIGILEHQNSVLRAELYAIESRTNQLTRVAIRSPEKNRKHMEGVSKSVQSLEHEIEKIRNARIRTTSKTTALQNYMDLIIKINGDLSDTLISREQIKAEIMRLSSRILPPHYTWPKEVQSPNSRRSRSASRTRSSGDATTSAVMQATIDSALALNNQLLNHSAISRQSRRSSSSTLGRSKSASSLNRSRTSTASTKSIARQGAVTYATRFAAAATAAATAARVHNTPSPVKSRPAATLYNGLTGTWSSESGPGSNIDGPTHGDRQLESRASFIPSGNQNVEFNVIASVSKAARAAKDLNATIASKYV
jgi:hypothetical protein